MKRLFAALILLIVTSLNADINVDSVRETTYDYACVDANDVILSKHQRLDKAEAACLTRKLNDPTGEYRMLGGSWRIAVTGALAQGYPGANNSLPEGAGEPPNDPPVWNTTPAPTFIEGSIASYDVGQHFSDPEADTLTLTNQAGCTPSLPSGMTIDDANDELDEDGTSPVATTTGCIFGIDDGTNPRVDSSAFSIVVSSNPAAATIYERDYSGLPRDGTSGGDET